ncbi:MAG: M48 family metalloprotease [Vicinamibacterales bacterium]
MSRLMLILIVGLSAYAALNLMCSLALAVAWRAGLLNNLAPSSSTRARRLAWWRAVPSFAAALAALVIVVPAFVGFEPHRDAEAVGPILPILALVTIAQFVASCWLALASAIRTRIVARAWLRAGTPLDVEPPAGVPAYAIDSRAPIVALVGVFWPKLIAARAVIDACTHEELRAIVSHERGHLHARDNMKRWLMACAPDALRWTPIHQEMCAAWHDAAEDAADDVATGGDEGARVNLATLLVKIARLAPEPAWPVATVSPFVQQDGLARRVRRLLEPTVKNHRTASLWPLPAFFCAALVTAVASPGVLNTVFDIVETLVVFGR